MLDLPHVSVVGEQTAISLSVCAPTPPSNCTNMIRACETRLSQLSFPFPLAPTYLKPFPRGCWKSLLLCVHLSRTDLALSLDRISQLRAPQVLRGVMAALENQILKELWW